MSNSFQDKRRVFLILLALFTGAAVPIQLITLSFGYAQYGKNILKGPKLIQTAHEFASYYIPLVYIPALVILLIIALYVRGRYPDIFRRIVVGYGVGAFATIFLDFFREMGVINKWLPGDTPALFGMMATGSKVFAVYYPIGFIIHFLNGADFGLFYTFVWGRRKSYRSAVFWAVLWLLIVELGMMTLPPMAPMVGSFGVKYAWPQLFLITLFAHIAYGVVLGILVQYFLKPEDERWLLGFLGKH